MLIDHVDIEKLPQLIVWLDWCIYAYWPTLVGSMTGFAVHLLVTHTGGDLLALLPVALFGGFCAWVVWCLAMYGYGVG